jgi:hypothetical protein
MIPIVSVIISILIFIGFYFLIKYTSKQFGYWLLYSYAALLLIFVVAYLFIPTDEALEVESTGDTGMFNSRNFILEGVAYGDQSIEEFDSAKKESWAFDGTDREGILLNNSNPHEYYVPVVAEEVAGQEEIIVTLYEQEPLVDVEIDEELYTPPNASYSNGMLTFDPPGQRSYQYAHVMKGFPFTQFREENWHYWSHHDYFYHEILFYVTVPEGMEIRAQQGTELHWVND